MHKIFISGSMRIKNLNNKVLERINNIINSQYEIIVGDADGVDSSIQAYLLSKNVKLVSVYCTGVQPRNNIGRWPIKKLELTQNQEQELISQQKTYLWLKIAILD